MSLFILDTNNIAKAVHLLHSSGELFEVRMINGNYNASGYFTSADTAIKALQDFRPSWNSRTPTAKASNIFITLNPINMSCYSRKQHDCFIESANPTTKDNEVTALHWLLIDLDPKRLSGVSSSEEELALAKQKSKVIRDFMFKRGFAEPICAMSGNGVHLVYRFDVPNTPENVSVFENALKVLSDKFSDEKVEVDTTVFNPARICKLWGTIAQKGATTPERPHRKAYIEPSTPSEILVLPKDRTGKRILSRLRPLKYLLMILHYFKHYRLNLRKISRLRTFPKAYRKAKKENLIYRNSSPSIISLSRALRTLQMVKLNTFLNIACLMKAIRERMQQFSNSLMALSATNASTTLVRVSIGKMSACSLNLMHTIKRTIKTVRKEKESCQHMTLTVQDFLQSRICRTICE